MAMLKVIEVLSPSSSKSWEGMPPRLPWVGQMRPCATNMEATVENGRIKTYRKMLKSHSR